MAAIFEAHPGWEGGIEFLLCQDEPCCMRCGRFTDDDGRGLEKAHIVAHMRGGSDTDPENFWVLCHPCHRGQPDLACREVQESWRLSGPSHEHHLFLMAKNMVVLIEAEETRLTRIRVASRILRSMRVPAGIRHDMLAMIP